MKKTVLVSGGAGYIGSHVTVELAEAGYIRKHGNTKKKVKITSKPFHYVTEDGYDIYVGKSSGKYVIVKRIGVCGEPFKKPGAEHCVCAVFYNYLGVGRKRIEFSKDLAFVVFDAVFGKDAKLRAFF